MKREDILEASKRENKKKDPYTVQVNAKGANIACIAMLILVFIYFITSVDNEIHSAFYSIIAIYQSVFWGYQAIKLDKCKKLNAFASIIWGMFTILLVLDYFKVI